MKNILITGLSGFVGSNLKDYLASDANLNLIAYSRSNSLVDLNQTDAIVHLAGKAHDLKNVSRPEDYYEANFELTKKLYDAFLLSNAKKFIFISSVKASADIVDGILTEDDNSNPKTHYGKSKLMAEEYIRSVRLPEGKYYFILRPCMIHGPGNKGNLNLLYKLVSKGIPWPLAAFNNSRSFLSIENLCFVIKEIIDRDDIPSGIYNVADDDTLSTNELIMLIAQSQNRKPMIWNISKKFIEGIASIGDKFHLPLNTERLHKLTSSYVVSNVKIKEAIGKPLPVSSKEGLMKTFQSFQNKK
jgi:nucleoside-diphosphate-sugar epimerase